MPLRSSSCWYILIRMELLGSLYEALKTRTLSYDDITHYRQIITVLLETDRLMKEIDN